MYLTSKRLMSPASRDKNPHERSGLLHCSKTCSMQLLGIRDFSLGQQLTTVSRRFPHRVSETQGEDLRGCPRCGTDLWLQSSTFATLAAAHRRTDRGGFAVAEPRQDVAFRPSSERAMK